MGHAFGSGTCNGEKGRRSNGFPSNENVGQNCICFIGRKQMVPARGWSRQKSVWMQSAKIYGPFWKSGHKIDGNGIFFQVGFASSSVLL